MKKNNKMKTLFVALAAALALVMSSFAWAAEPAQAPAPKTAVKAKAKKAAPKKAWVKKVQIALNKAGYKVKADGIMGKKTRTAIKSFQKNNKMKATGRVNKTTLAKLGLK